MDIMRKTPLRDKPADKINITPEMVEAGTSVLADLTGEVTLETQVREVFLAMETVRPKEKQGRMAPPNHKRRSP